MKKWIAYTLIIILSFILILFSVHKPTSMPSEKEEYIPSLELLYQGKMDGINFALGTDSNTIITQWGVPNQNVEFMGSILLAYNDIYFFTYKNKIVGIYYNGKETVYGVKIGSSLDKVADLLGKPNNTFTSQYNELYVDDNLILVYKAGEYSVNFEIDPKSETVSSISIWQEDTN